MSITCMMRPSDSLSRKLGRMGIVDPKEQMNVARMLDELVTVDVFAQLLDEALVATTKGSGTLDLKAVAEYVLRKMREHPL